MKIKTSLKMTALSLFAVLTTGCLLDSNSTEKTPSPTPVNSQTQGAVLDQP